MMSSFKYVTCVFVVSIILTAGAAVAIEYFPSEPGPVFVYGINSVSVQSLDADRFIRKLMSSGGVGYNESFIITPEGDVLIYSRGWWAASAPSPDTYDIEPSLIYLDFPLQTSKSWESTGIETDMWGNNPGGTVTLTGKVEGRQTVTVPAGEFEVIVVTLDFDYELTNVDDRHEVLWLHAQLGPVNELTSWSGIVATENTSWGSVKSMYR